MELEAAAWLWERTQGGCSYLVTHVAGVGFPRRAALGSRLPRRSYGRWALPVTQQEPITLQEKPRGGAWAGEIIGSTRFASCALLLNFWRRMLNLLSQQVSKIIVGALNQNLVEFELKPGVRVIVYITQLTLGRRLLVDCQMLRFIQEAQCLYTQPYMYLCTFGMIVV